MTAINTGTLSSVSDKLHQSGDLKVKKLGQEPGGALKEPAKNNTIAPADNSAVEIAISSTNSSVLHSKLTGSEPK